MKKESRGGSKGQDDDDSSSSSSQAASGDENVDGGRNVGPAAGTAGAEVDAVRGTSSAAPPPVVGDEPSRILVTDLQEADVLLGRGTGPANHEGNVYFRDAVDRMKPDYVATPSRRVKNRLVHEVVQDIKSRNGRFVKKLSASEAEKAIDEGLLQDSSRDMAAYEVVTDLVAFEKTKQAIRYIHYKKEPSDNDAAEQQEGQQQDGARRQRQDGATKMARRLPATIAAETAPYTSSSSSAGGGSSTRKRSRRTKEEEEHAVGAVAGQTMFSEEENKRRLFRLRSPIDSSSQRDGQQVGGEGGGGALGLLLGRLQHQNEISTHHDHDSTTTTSTARPNSSINDVSTNAFMRDEDFARTTTPSLAARLLSASAPGRQWSNDAFPHRGMSNLLLQQLLVSQNFRGGRAGQHVHPAVAVGTAGLLQESGLGELVAASSLSPASHQLLLLKQSAILNQLSSSGGGASGGAGTEDRRGQEEEHYRQPRDQLSATAATSPSFPPLTLQRLQQLGLLDPTTLSGGGLRQSSFLSSSSLDTIPPAFLLAASSNPSVLLDHLRLLPQVHQGGRGHHGDHAAGSGGGAGNILLPPGGAQPRPQAWPSLSAAADAPLVLQQRDAPGPASPGKNFVGVLGGVGTTDTKAPVGRVVEPVRQKSIIGEQAANATTFCSSANEAAVGVLGGSNTRNDTATSAPPQEPTSGSTTAIPAGERTGDSTSTSTAISSALITFLAQKRRGGSNKKKPGC